MTIVPATCHSVKSSRKPLEQNETRTVSLKDAIALVREADQVGFSCRVNDQGHYVILDVSITAALRSLRRLKGRVANVNLADIFGSLVIG